MLAIEVMRNKEPILINDASSKMICSSDAALTATVERPQSRQEVVLKQPKDSYCITKPAHVCHAISKFIVDSRIVFITNFTLFEVKRIFVLTSFGKRTI